MSEKRNLSEEIAFDLADLLYFTSLEKEYFLSLVKIRNSGNMKLKKFYQEQKNELKNKSLNLSERIEHKNVLSEVPKVTKLLLGLCALLFNGNDRFNFDCVFGANSHIFYTFDVKIAHF